MPITVIRRPVIVSGPTTFQFNAVGLPTIYEFERRDFTYSQINNSAGKIQLQFTGVNLTTSFSLGDSLYVKSLTGTVHDLNTVVTSVSFTAGNTLVTTNTNYIGASSSGFVNNNTSRKGYYIQVRFYNGSGALYSQAIFETSPTAKGRSIADVSEFIKAILSPETNADLTDYSIAQINQDTNAVKYLRIGYREVWIGSQELETSDAANPIYPVLGALQIPRTNSSVYGVNNQDYVSTITGTIKIQAKFLQRMVRPVLYRLKINVIQFLLIDLVGSDVYLRLQGVTSGNTINLTSGVTSDHQLLTAQFGDLDWTQFSNDREINISVRNTADNSAVTEVLKCELKDFCANDVMLYYRNSLGGLRSFAFEFNQEYSYTYEDGTRCKRVKLFATDLTADRWEELHDIMTMNPIVKENIIEVTGSTIKTKTRPGQQLYIQDSSNNSILGVIAIPVQNITESRRVKHSMEITIELPEFMSV